MSKQMRLYRSTRTRDLDVDPFDEPPRDDFWEFVGIVSSGRPSTYAIPTLFPGDTITSRQDPAPATGKVVATVEGVLRAVAIAEGQLHVPWQPPEQPKPARPVDPLFAINAYRKARNLPPVQTIQEAY